MSRFEPVATDLWECFVSGEPWKDGQKVVEVEGREKSPDGKFVAFHMSDGSILEFSERGVFKFVREA